MGTPCEGEVKVVEGLHRNLEKHADRRKKRGHESDGRLFTSRFGPSDRHCLIDRILTLSLLPCYRQYRSFDLDFYYPSAFFTLSIAALQLFVLVDGQAFERLDRGFGRILGL